MGVKKDLEYPFLLGCCGVAPEQFWKSVFEDLAYGKAPYGAFISKGFLTCTYKDKEFSYRLEEKPPEVLYRDIYDLLVKRLGLLSASEHNQRRLLFEKLENSIRERREDWCKIRRKNIKDLIIEKYVVNMKIKNGLSYYQARKLSAVIFVAMQFKTITNSDINYTEGEILSINGISFREGKIVLNKNILRL